MLPTASSLQRVLICPTSHALPQVKQNTEASRKGNGVHDFLARTLTGSEVKTALADVAPEFHQDCLDIDVESLPSELTSLRVEWSVAYNPVTRAVLDLGDNIGRRYAQVFAEKAPGHDISHWYFGTMDYCGRQENGVLRIGDFKTGNAFSTPAAKENSQLLFGALCVTKLLGEQECDAEIIKTKDEVRSDIAHFDGFALESFAFDLNVLHATLSTTGKLPVIEGEHCRWCPGFNHCPSKMRLIARIATSPNSLSDEIFDKLRSGDAREAYARYRAVRMAFRMLELKFREYAEHNGGIPTSNGKRWGPVTTDKLRIDPEIAFNVISERFGTTVARDAMELNTSKSRIGKALKPLSARGKHAATLKSTMSDISGAGGFTKKTKTEFSEYEPTTGEETDDGETEQDDAA